MPKVRLELAPNKWVELDVTYEERRAILLAVKPERRFIDEEHTVRIVLPLPEQELRDTDGN